MNIRKLFRIAMGAPVVVYIAASLAWDIWRMPRGEREEFAEALHDVLFERDGGK